MKNNEIKKDCFFFFFKEAVLNIGSLVWISLLKHIMI